MDKTTLTLGQKLALLRKAHAKRLKRKVPQAEVAAAVGIARSTVSAYEKGHDKPGRETLAALAEFYNVSIDYVSGSSDAVLLDPHDIAQTPEERILLRTFRLASAKKKAGILSILDGDDGAQSNAA